MITLKSDNIAFFDVDETLVHILGSIDDRPGAIAIAIPGRQPNFCLPIQEHISRLKQHHAWGNGVVVWSRSGYEWAKAVVDALGLEQYVDLVMAKGFYYYDDKKCCQIMGEHRYLINN